MTQTTSTGPLVSAGTLLGSIGAPDANIVAGPSLFFQGTGFPDPRFTIPNRGIGSVPSFLFRQEVRVIDQFPVASAATPVGIASVQNVTNGTAMTLSGPNAAIPFYPIGQVSNPITPALTLDFGAGLVATTANSGTVTPVAALLPFLQAGQNIVIADVGNAGGTMPLFTKVTAVGASTITVSPVPLATNGATHVGQANIMSPLAGASGTGQNPAIEGGLGAFWDPKQLLARGVAIGGSTGSTGGNFLVTGWDVWGVPMSELITVGAGAVSGYGKKAFKHIGTVAPQFTDAHNYSAGPSDVVGFPIRNDGWQYNEIYVGTSFLTATTGYTAAVTATATTTTGDVRGTIQTGPRGPLGSGATGASLDGATAVVVTVSIPVLAATTATQANSTSLFGVAQA